MQSPFGFTPNQRESFSRIPTFPDLPLHFSERRLLLLSIDMLLLNGVLGLILLRNGWLQPTLLDFWLHMHWFLLLMLLWMVIGRLADVYNLARAANPMHSLWSTAGAALLTTLLYLVIPVLTPDLIEKRWIFYLFPLLSVVALACWRVAYARIFNQPGFHQTALVIGAGWAGRTLLQAMGGQGLAGNPFYGTGYRVLGLIDDDPAKQGKALEGVPVLGTRHELLHLVQALHPDELILAITHMDRVEASLVDALLHCSEMGVPITTMSSLYERLTGRIAIEHTGYNNLAAVLPMQPRTLNRLYNLLIRLLDICAGAVGCLGIGLLVPWVWLINQLISPGPLFFVQERVGQGGKRFHIVKFRSMIVDAEKQTGAVWAAENDPRITPLGRFLRKTRLDEVPQFWNVLKGEMSLIGPRPERPEFVAELDRRIPFYRTRHAIKPGITGWAQVKYRYGASVDDARVKLQYDLYYIKHRGPFLDLQILLITIQVVLGLRGR